MPAFKSITAVSTRTQSTTFTGSCRRNSAIVNATTSARSCTDCLAALISSFGTLVVGGRARKTIFTTSFPKTVSTAGRYRAHVKRTHAPDPFDRATLYNYDPADYEELHDSAHLVNDVSGRESSYYKQSPEGRCNSRQSSCNHLTIERDSTASMSKLDSIAHMAKPESPDMYASVSNINMLGLSSDEDNHNTSGADNASEFISEPNLLLVDSQPSCRGMRESTVNFETSRTQGLRQRLNSTGTMTSSSDTEVDSAYQRRQYGSILKVSRRWNIPEADAAEIMANVERACSR